MIEPRDMPLEAELRELMPRLSDEGIERAIARYKRMPFNLSDPAMFAGFAARCEDDDRGGFAGIV